MSTGAIVGIIIAIIIVAAVVVVASAQLRRARMRRQFGPEYDRLAQEIGPRKADAELAARQRRVDALDIHPLSAEQQARYAGDWTVIQEQFVDSPARAVTAARTLIWDVMRDRGYPADDRNASTEALSVYHARSFAGYRTTQDLRTDTATTEQFREALISSRALFEDLTGLGAVRAQPEAAGAAAAEPDDRMAGTDDRMAGTDDRMAGTDRVAAGSSGGIAEDPDLAAQNRDLAADNIDRTANTPR